MPIGDWLRPSAAIARDGGPKDSQNQEGEGHPHELRWPHNGMFTRIASVAQTVKPMNYRLQRKENAGLPAFRCCGCRSIVLTVVSAWFVCSSPSVVVPRKVDEEFSAMETKRDRSLQCENDDQNTRADWIIPRLNAYNHER